MKKDKLECPKSIRNYKKNNAWKHQMLGRVVRPSNPAYYIEKIISIVAHSILAC